MKNMKDSTETVLEFVGLATIIRTVVKWAVDKYYTKRSNLK